MGTCGMKDWHVTLDAERLSVKGTRLMSWHPLTELSDATHACGQQGLFNGPQLRLAEHG